MMTCATLRSEDIEMDKDAFQKAGRVLRDRISLVTKKRVLSCYVTTVLLHGSECWTVSSKMKRLEAAEIWFYTKSV